MAAKICLGFFGVFILVAAVRQWGGVQGPTIDAALYALLAGAMLSYVPLWTQSVRTGETSLGSRIVRRRHQPVLFWVVASLHIVMALVIAGFMLMRLPGLR